MGEVVLVLSREFLERVRTRAFLMGTVLFPVFIVAVFVLPEMFDDRGEERRVAVVDETAAGIGRVFAEILGAPPESENANRYVVELVPGPADAVRQELNARVRSEELYAYVVLPPDLLERNRILYRSATIPGPGVLREIRVAASQAAQAERLRAAGLEVQEVAALLRAVEVDDARITETGEEGGDARSTFFAAYIIAFVIYFMVAMYGVAVMRSVLEEKTNRIAEVLVSSLRASHLMAGKVLGVGSAALLQVLIWAALMVVLFTQSGFFASRLGIPPGALQGIGIEPGMGLLLFGFFVLGFFLFASLFAALGAAVTSEQETQSLQMVFMLPLFVPLIFLVPLTTDPLGTLATALGLFPLTAPIAMPMRMAAAPVPGVQVAASLVLLALALVATAWVSGKVYRIGILATGKRPSLKELGRWLRAA